MTTSDGISSEEWERVRELCVNCFNALDTDNETASRSELHDYLDHLEGKYGLLPSIVATRADFIDDTSAKQALLHQAYELAQARTDERNALLIAHSLAEFYLEDPPNIIDAALWLERLRKHLIDTPDVDFANDHERLSERLDELMR